MVVCAGGVPTTLIELADCAEHYGVWPSELMIQIFGSVKMFRKWCKQFKCNPEDN